MSATDRVVTLVWLMKLEAPGGDVNLCDGGFVDFDAGGGVERYSDRHATFGTLAAPDEFEAGFGDMAEAGTLALVPAPGAALTSWYSNTLRDARVRFWLGELDVDGKTVTAAKLIGDLLVDNLARTIGADGSLVLELPLIGRAEKLFLINEGNVCSERFHKSVWSGEDGFNNCTDTPQPVAWGIASQPSGTTGSSFGGGQSPGSGSGGGGGLFESVAR
jgi:hypothetical protein